jgi:hypothetical protein
MRQQQQQQFDLFPLLHNLRDDGDMSVLLSLLAAAIGGSHCRRNFLTADEVMMHWRPPKALGNRFRVS